jgi:hypothetical protein
MQTQPHRFYQWSKRKQNVFIILCVLSFMGIIGFSLAGLLLGWFWSVLLFPLIFIPAQCVDTPLGFRSGRLIYFSPLFLVEKRDSGDYVLHGGTIFDYFFVFSWQDAGETARQQVLKDFMLGLLTFTEHLEQHDLEEATINGSSYFFNARNAKRYGFKIVETEQSQQITLGMNYVVLILMYSFTHGKIAFPPIGKITTVSSTGGQLIKNKQQITKVLSRIGPRADDTA